MLRIQTKPYIDPEWQKEHPDKDYIWSWVDSAEFAKLLHVSDHLKWLSETYGANTTFANMPDEALLKIYEELRPHYYIQLSSQCSFPAFAVSNIQYEATEEEYNNYMLELGRQRILEKYL